MLLQDKLETIAEIAIPNKIHPLLHVNCQQAWTSRVAALIKKKQVRPNIQSLTVLAKNWETLLINYYSTQN